MKVFTKHVDHKPVYEEKLKACSNIDFSLFVDIPYHISQLSSINIMVLQEPDEYFGIHSWTIVNKDQFQLILSWNDKVLNNCAQAMYNPFGHTWLKPDQYTKQREKKFEVAHLAGKLQMSYGHSLRHEILARQDEIKIKKRFFHTYGERDDIEKARIGKEEVFADSMFNVAIENFSHRGYFTEKLLDCFLFKSIPIYWGASNIGEYFNTLSIIQVSNVDDVINFCNGELVKDNFYSSNNGVKRAIEDNYKRALQYLDFEQMAVDKIIEVFKHNDLI